MRDRRFIAEHRGGPLRKEQQCQLILWACACSSHVLPLIENQIDVRLTNAIRVGREWAQGNATVGDARKASVGAIRVANENSDPVLVAVARSVGHAVATAHMADHSPGSADYALKAAKHAGISIEAERKWQDEQLPEGIRELVLTSRSLRSLKI